MLYNIIELLIGCETMKERIIEALKSVHRALNYEEIDSLLNLKTIEETKEMNDALEELENNGEIYHSNKNNTKFQIVINEKQSGTLQLKNLVTDTEYKCYRQKD